MIWKLHFVCWSGNFETRATIADVWASALQAGGASGGVNTEEIGVCLYGASWLD